MNRELLLAKNIIKFEEGLRLKPYYCSLGFPTIGYGELIGKKGDPLPDIEWSEDQAEVALNSKLLTAVKELSSNKVTEVIWKSLQEDTDRKAILISMWYQLGIKKLSGFVNTISAIQKKDWVKAKEEMLNSEAARETPKRWKRQSTAMESGDVLSTYKF